MFASVDRDPSTVNDASAKATQGVLYTYAGSSGAPKGIYRYVQIKDLAVDDGDVLCRDAANNTTATQDRSADLHSATFAGVAVGTVTADYYTYVLVHGVHTNVLGDGSVAVGDALYPHASTDGAADTRAETVASSSFGEALTDDDSNSRFTAEIRGL